MIKQTLKRITQSLMLVPLLTLAISVAVPAGVSAEVQCTNLGSGTADPLSDGSKCAKGTGQGEDLTNVFRTVANIMLFLVGAVAVIMLIIGGLRYVTSNGDATQVTGAKNTIMYAIIGIVVAFLAFAAVNFVTTQLQNSNT